MSDPSDLAYKSAVRMVQEYYPGSNCRAASERTPKRVTLQSLGIQPGEHAADRGLSIPLCGEEPAALDVARVAAEVMRGGQLMHTIAVSEASACVLYDAASAVGGLDLPPASGDFTVVVANKGRLVGQLLPIIGQLREIRDQTKVVKKRRSEFACQLDPIQPLRDDGELPRPHKIAFKPVQVSTTDSASGTGTFLLQVGRAAWPGGGAGPATAQPAA